MTMVKADAEFMRERWLREARWVVTLSNGEEVVQDDGRPDVVMSAWQRLRAYVLENKLKIVSMHLQFRDQPKIHLPARAEGYFFRSSVGAFMHAKQSYEFFLAGTLQNGVVKVRRWQVPAMAQIGPEEERSPNDEEAVGPSLIINN